MEGKDAIFPSGRHPFDGKIALSVGACHAFKRQAGESCVGIARVEADEYALHRFEVLGVEHMPRDLHRIGHCARREDVGVLPEWVAFVVVGDGIGKVDRVGGVGNERIEDFDRHTASRHLNFGLLLLWGRHRNLFVGIVDLDEFVKHEGEFRALPTGHLFRVGGRDNARRSFVVGAAVRARTLVGAGRDEGGESH